MADKGKVKWFSNVKGYGFLRKDGEERDIFVHYSAIQGDGYKRLNPDEEVEFEVVEGEKGPQAQNVVRTKKPKEEPADGAGESKPEEKKKDGK
ncbi:MAG: Cold shock protein CspD [Candidatus Omnitrophica bacterium ADurb.Bin292]|jgi:CspA family cold shock protein|nr:MAG: Cold shock protein CspD [Candidatus Omnitrophica bacterium ADurb.Bin292]HOG23180.1 cold shock domain-containing protein [Candidatus Omnitrophota bacterium]HPW76720.1 cold shock domain-containing protein [Candidatus Omnitrophota bacterium]